MYRSTSFSKFVVRDVLSEFRRNLQSNRGISSISLDGKSCGSGKRKSKDKCEKGAINVAIIGGGMSSMYAAILLKQSTIIQCVHLVDTNGTLSGLIFDANHIDTSTRLKHFKEKRISEALNNMDIIALMDRSDFNVGNDTPRAQFMGSADYVRKMAEKMVRFCPEALVAIFARPVTATLPLVSEIYKCRGFWDPDRIIGSTTIDAMRAESETAHFLGLWPTSLSIPIVGGADPCTVIPLLSRAKPVNIFSSDHEDLLINRVRSADKELAATEWKEAKVSFGAAAAKMIVALAAGLGGHKNVISSAFAWSNVLPMCRFFSTELEFGRQGVKRNLGLPKISSKEVSSIGQAIPIIAEMVDLGIKAAHEKSNISGISQF